MFLEASLKNTMFIILQENARFYETTMCMDANPYIEGAIYDVQKSPMKFYNGLVKDDFIKTPVDFEKGGGIKTTVYGQGNYKTV
jgi:hypothetical protein